MGAVSPFWILVPGSMSPIREFSETHSGAMGLQAGIQHSGRFRSTLQISSIYNTSTDTASLYNRITLLVLN